jgi:hypothetical protein
MVAYGIFSAQRLFQHLNGEGLIAVVQAERLSEAQAKAKLAKLSAGDLIFYAPKSLNAYRHVGLFLGGSTSRMACHTDCRCDVVDGYPQEWNSVAFKKADGSADVTLYTLAQIL